MTADELVGRTIAGRWRVESPLAAGAMGAVYVATHVDDGTKAALKVIRADLAADDRFRARFATERAALARLRHDNIVALLDAGSDGALLFLATELAHGDTLHHRVRTHGALPTRDAIAVLAQIAAALEAAHALSVVHRDLKPKNVVLADIVKVLDFGIARILDDDVPGAKTTTGVVVGTPGYVAPERMQGERAHPSHDVYALGALAWDVLAGRGPFSAPTQVMLAVKHMTAPPPSLLTAVEVPDELALLVTRMLDKSAARRPSAAEARAVLSALA